MCRALARRSNPASSRAAAPPAAVSLPVSDTSSHAVLGLMARENESGVARRVATDLLFVPISGRAASLDRLAVVPTSAEFCFGMNSSAALAPAPRSQGACRSLTRAGQQAPRRCRSHRPSGRQLEPLDVFPDGRGGALTLESCFVSERKPANATGRAVAAGQRARASGLSDARALVPGAARRQVSNWMDGAAWRTAIRRGPVSGVHSVGPARLGSVWARACRFELTRGATRSGSR